MKKGIIILVIALVLMEGVSWWAYKSLFSKNTDETPKAPEEQQVLNPLSNPLVSQQQIKESESDLLNYDQVSEVPQTSSADLPPKGMASDSESFPPLSTEVVNGRTERTIHMGVRKYEWDPATVTAKKGELVRLIIHNADVKHGLVIPDLGVNQDIPEDGAVVEFVASKVGTFEFFCSVWCGEGHMEMRGKIVIE